MFSSICTSQPPLVPALRTSLHTYTQCEELLQSLATLDVLISEHGWVGGGSHTLHRNLHHIATLLKVFLSAWIRIQFKPTEVEEKVLL